MPENRLSLCIATWNRAGYLASTLECIVPEMEESVEVVVVDGGSADSTMAVVEEYSARIARLRYIRLESAGGVDRDYARAVDAASGEYCWLMSDDDMLKPGAVRAVLDRIREGYSLIVVNAEVRTADLSEVLERRRLPFTENREYRPEDLDRLFADAGSYLSYIGCVVVRKDLWSAREKEPYIGTEFIHVGVIFQAPLPERTLIVSEPLIAIRYGNAQWTPRSFEVWMFKWPSLVWSFAHIAGWAKERVVARTPWRQTRTLMRYRAVGAYTPQVYASMIKPIAGSFGMSARAWTVAQIPGVIANLAGLAYYRWFRPTSPLELADMRSSRFYPFRAQGPP